MSKAMEDFLKRKGVVSDRDTYKPIPGYEEEYGISETGEILSFRTGGVLKQGIDTHGYWYVVLSDKFSEKHIHRTHILVELTYIPNPNNLPVVDHKDGNKQHPHVTNLEWVTQQENTQRAYNNGLAKKKGIAVAMLDKDTLEVIERFDKVQDASDALGKPRNSRVIFQALNQPEKTAYGYAWKTTNPEDDGRIWET